jgi:hypothetical protein
MKKYQIKEFQKAKKIYRPARERVARRFWVAKRLEHRRIK